MKRVYKVRRNELRRNELRLYVDADQDTPINIVFHRGAINCAFTRRCNKLHFYIQTDKDQYYCKYTNFN